MKEPKSQRERKIEERNKEKKGEVREINREKCEIYIN